MKSRSGHLSGGAQEEQVQQECRNASKVKTQGRRLAALVSGNQNQREDKVLHVAAGI